MWGEVRLSLVRDHDPASCTAGLLGLALGVVPLDDFGRLVPGDAEQIRPVVTLGVALDDRGTTITRVTFGVVLDAVFAVVRVIRDSVVVLVEVQRGAVVAVESLRGLELVGLAVAVVVQVVAEFGGARVDLVVLVVAVAVLDGVAVVVLVRAAAAERGEQDEPAGGQGQGGQQGDHGLGVLGGVHFDTPRVVRYGMSSGRACVSLAFSFSEAQRREVT